MNEKQDNLKNAIEANYDTIIRQSKILPENIDYSLVEKHIPFFKMMESANTSVVFVYDLFKGNIFYISDSFFDLLGFSSRRNKKTDVDYFRSRFHPDDYYIYKAGIEFFKFLYSLPSSQRKNYKSIYECRFKNEKGEFFRVIVQDYIIELDAVGNPWLDMKLIDLAPIQDLKSPAKIVIRNVKTGETIFAKENDIEDKKQLSDREKQILQLISEGNKSKEIAEQLYISVNTVNNHRSNILQKMNVSNTSEAVRHATMMGLL